MSRATPQTRDFAERLIAYETRENKSFGTSIPVAFHVCDKLRPHFATLMGKEGFRALLMRALAVARAEAPQLSEVQVKADGSLAGLDEPRGQVHSESMAKGGLVLVAQVVGLLEAFIGEGLTLRMLHDVWPKLSLSELYFDNGNKNEKAKPRG